MNSKIDSLSPFRRYGVAWKLLGLNTSGNKYLCGLYDFLLNIFVTFYYPVHLALGLLETKSQEETYSNLVISVAVIGASLKYIVYRRKLHQMAKLNEIFKELDLRVHHKEEIHYFRREILRESHRLINFTIFMYIWPSVGSLAITFIYKEKRLLQTGWFPFDWRASDVNYLSAIFYQFVAESLQVLQGFAADLYAPLAMLMCTGHVHLLSVRVSQIGHDKKITSEQHLLDLTACIKDYHQLMGACKIIEDTASWAVFIQLIVTALNVCVAVVYVALYAKSFLFYIFYAFITMASLWELFPACYYGSRLQYELRELPYAIFSCNWLDQKPLFRRNAIIFVQLTLKVVTLNAGNIAKIHLDSFFATCRMAYSLFACIISVR